MYYEFLLFDRVENIVVKGETAGNLHFLLFRHCFRKPISVTTDIFTVDIEQFFTVKRGKHIH